MSHSSQPVYKLAIFASGTGSNAEQIIQYFKDSDLAQVVLVVSNKPQAVSRERNSFVLAAHGLLLAATTRISPSAGRSASRSRPR